MREEIKNWWLQAKHDLEAAKKNLKIEEYYLVAFLCQQAVEKGLKALYMLKKKDIITTHSLMELGRRLKAEERILKNLRKLAPEYTISRYPDVTDTLPFENYDEHIAKDRLKSAEEVFTWLNTQMK